MICFGWEVYFNWGFGLGLDEDDLGVVGLGRLTWMGLKFFLVLWYLLPWASMM